MKLDNKLEKLEAILKDYPRILIALSGGVDSAFLLTFAVKAMGKDRVSAVTACGPHLAKDESAYAERLCRHLGVDHDFTDVGHILSVIKPNPADRCYLCKKEMFSMLKEKAEATDSILADGTNLDDMDDYRPGHRALNELKISSPLKDAGLTKNDIRQALKAIAKADERIYSALILDEGIPMWEKPAFACLASRIPYGERITEEKLSAVYEAELFLRSLGFAQVRVRHHGDTARIEVPREDRRNFFDEDFMDNVTEKIKRLGFRYVVLDLGGYKMGGGYHDGQQPKQQSKQQPK